MDYVIVVTSHLRLRTERVMERGVLTREEFLRRLELQWSDEDKTHMADYVIHNNGTLEDLMNESKKVFDLIHDDYLYAKVLNSFGIDFYNDSNAV